MPVEIHYALVAMCRIEGGQMALEVRPGAPRSVLPHVICVALVARSGAAKVVVGCGLIRCDRKLLDPAECLDLCRAVVRDEPDLAELMEDTGCELKASLVNLTGEDAELSQEVVGKIFSRQNILWSVAGSA